VEERFVKRLLLGLLVFACAAAAFADKIVLNDGRTYEGVIVEETDESVKIRVGKGALSFPKSQVKSIERGGTDNAGQLEQKLAALDPAKPAGYLEVASWLCGDGRPVLEIKLLKRLCNGAASLDKSLACKAQMLLGKELITVKDQTGAARAFKMASNADPADKDAAKRAGEMESMAIIGAKDDLKQIRAAMTLLTDKKLVEAIRAMRICQNGYFGPEAAKYFGMPLDKLADQLQKRVPCDGCGGRAEVKCLQCSGKGTNICGACDGTGKRKGMSMGVDAGGGFKNSVCRSCFAMTSYLCEKCKAERVVVVRVHQVLSVFKTKDIKITMKAREETEALKKEFDLITMRTKDNVWEVEGVTIQEPYIGGKVTCGTCKGIPFEANAAPLDLSGLDLYCKEIDDMLQGKRPIDALRVADATFDAEIVDSGLRYKDGKWSR
jgi:hypothetical protein